MKKYYFLIIVALILGLVLTGCSLLSNISQVPATEQSGMINLTKGTSGIITLYAGQDLPVGTVTVSNDGINLFVEYITTGGWVMTETHLAVAPVQRVLGEIPDPIPDPSPEDIPQTKKGNPIPGQFPYKHEDLGYITSDPYIIPLSEIDIGVGADDILYIAAHAKVIRPIEDCWETVWQIGDVEVNDCAGNLTNYANEFNWKKLDLSGGYTLPVGDCEQGPGLDADKPLFTTPFIAGTTPTDEFPYNSNFSKSYATDFDVQWNGSLPFGGLLTISWSPGSSASEKKVVSNDGIASTTFTAQGASKPGEGWFMDKYPLVENSVNVDPLSDGLHTINFQHTKGDGTFWDWIRLEKPCVQEESAWAGTGVGEIPFSGKNWATYFTYTVQLPQDGMVLWLDAGKGITASGVSKWEDQSGNGNDATQANPSYQPIYVENALNFRPVVRFIGGEKYLRHSPILTSDYTAFYVLKLTESEKNLLYYYHAGNVNAGDLGFFAENENKAEGWGSVGLPDVRTSIVHPTLDDWRIHTHQPEALHKDGVEISYARNQNVYAAGLTDIGSRSDHATLYFVGDIAEILVYDRILSDSEREFVETYLNAKYNIY